ncbi:MAG: hypothetical protein U0871_26445 [Gemmataceae bacterium]
MLPSGTTDVAVTWANGLAGSSFTRTANRKNWLAARSRRATVAGARPRVCR